MDGVAHFSTPLPARRTTTYPNLGGVTDAGCQHSKLEAPQTLAAITPSATILRSRPRLSFDHPQNNPHVHHITSHHLITTPSPPTPHKTRHTQHHTTHKLHQHYRPRTHTPIELNRRGLLDLFKKLGLEHSVREPGPPPVRPRQVVAWWWE